MKHMLLTGCAVVISLTMSISVFAQGRPADAGSNSQQTQSEQQPNTSDAKRERAEMKRLEAEAKRAEAEAHNQSEAMRAEHLPNERANDAVDAAEHNADRSENAGGEKADEMGARRDEGKAIKEQYRDDREAGQEGANLDDDEAETAGEQQKKAKKPWWKLWGD
jgi:colicin import membrane protein